MRTVTFTSVLDGVLALAGMKLATIANPDDVKAQVTGFINLRVREAVEHEFWPELCPAEHRWYRPIWAASATYAADDEVYYGSDAVTDVVAQMAFSAGVWFLTWGDCDDGLAGYFTPNTADMPAAAQSPATNPEKWLRIRNLRRFIALDQPGLTPIGEVMSLTRRDTRVSPTRSWRVPFTLSSEGIVPSPHAGNSVWVEFRLRPPEFEAGDYEAEPEKTIPYVLAAFVTRAAYADLLNGEDRGDDAARAESRAYLQLQNAVDVSGPSQGQFSTAQVKTY